MNSTTDSESPSLEPEPAAHKASDADGGGCWVCGGQVENRHCKIICPRCGFTRDCSDP